MAEIGINHNGRLDFSLEMINQAKRAGCNAVKFQKRNPVRCVPSREKQRKLETPWGYICYLDYRKKMEFGLKEYRKIDSYCKKIGMTWFASCWDEDSVNFITQFNVPCLKVPSACITDFKLLKQFHKTGLPIILSTGMSRLDQIENAVQKLNTSNLIILHSTSIYPCPVEKLNLKAIHTLKQKFDCPIGYSGHEVGLPTTIAAVVLGACVIERHLTLDRSMWGSDQAASIEPVGFVRLVKYIRTVEQALGDGEKKIDQQELVAMKKLRKIGFSV